jgi:crotonobetainyl-CoA:carnitine CoA-transferase CaiB-like acyl-CoA transferase
VPGADVLIESGEVGRMADLGLSYGDLAAVNPALVYTSITAFGQTGPRAHWLATDLTVWASAGPLVLTGDEDRPPVRPGVPQAFLHASAEAAGAIIAALHERATSGHGQHIDVSAQIACSQATQSAILAAPNNATMLTRAAGSIKLGPALIQLLWPCRDGHVSITFLFGTAIGPASERLVRWMYETGHATEEQRDTDWVSYAERIFTEEGLAHYGAVKEAIGRFCAERTKAELLAGALERRLLIAPVQMVDDVVHAEQFEFRDFWRDVDGVRYPGPFAKLSATPLPTPTPAPTLGRDTARVLAAAARTVDAPAPAVPVPNHRPLEGVKVLDFMWVMAGPAATRVLADLGATVVRVESSHRVETARTLQPFKDDVSGVENSTLFFNLNAGKLGIALDPTTPEGRAVVHDLVRWADVVTESFSPKAMRASVSTTRR